MLIVPVMMKNKKTSKLSLSRETLRALAPRALGQVAGGAIVEYTPGCISRTNSCGDTVYLCTATTCLNCGAK